LTGAGAQVNDAGTAEDGIALVDAERFDLIFLDMRLPALDGFGTAERLRARGFAGPIVAMSAFGSKPERGRCLAAGCSELVAKPVDASTLVRVAAQWLRA